MEELIERLIEEVDIVLDSELIVSYDDSEMVGLNGFSKAGLIRHLQNRMRDIAEEYMEELQ